MPMMSMLLLLGLSFLRVVVLCGDAKGFITNTSWCDARVLMVVTSFFLFSRRVRFLGPREKVCPLWCNFMDGRQSLVSEEKEKREEEKSSVQCDDDAPPPFF
jgi:hypothetical protein